MGREYEGAVQVVSIVGTGRGVGCDLFEFLPVEDQRLLCRESFPELNIALYDVAVGGPASEADNGR